MTPIRIFPVYSSMLTHFNALLAGYCCGACPFGLWLACLKGYGDLRKLGSGNIGATNVLRQTSRGLALLTLCCDVLKAYLPVKLTLMFVPGDHGVALYLALGAFLGHVYSFWCRFKGGKGVAVFLGNLAALCPPFALFFIIVWIVVAVFSRYASLASLCASACACIGLVVFSPDVPLNSIMVFMTVILWWKHSENLTRLLLGQEHKFGRRGGRT